MNGSNLISTTLRCEKGAALISVAWLILLLSLLAVGILALTSSVRQNVASLQQSIQAQYIADSAVDLYLRRYFFDDETGLALSASFNLENRQVTVDVAYENGKINLNLASPAMLSALFAAGGKNENEARALADAVADWRDTDETPRAYGAEADAYMNASLEQRPRNGAFETVGELLYVKGMDKNTFVCVSPLLTISSRILVSHADALFEHQSAVDINRTGNRVQYVLQWAYDAVWQGKDWIDPSALGPGEAGSRSGLAGQGLHLQITIANSEGKPTTRTEAYVRFLEAQAESDTAYAIITPPRPVTISAPNDQCQIP